MIIKMYYPYAGQSSHKAPAKSTVSRKGLYTCRLSSLGVLIDNAISNAILEKVFKTNYIFNVFARIMPTTLCGSMRDDWLREGGK